ncbi:MAG: M12 family metallo-peptidase, partial [Thermoanaerobaculia bacterium]
DLELERFLVFAPDALIVIDGTKERPVPENVYFKGRIEGDLGSRVLLTLRQSGELRGLVFRPGELWVLAGGTGTGIAAPGLIGRRADPDLELADRTSSFSCKTDALPTPDDWAVNPPPLSTPSVVIEPGASPSYTARVALETDYEYYAHFGNETDALDYAADLIAYSSTIYQDETDTSLEIDYTSIWTTPSSDPWDETSCELMLYEFRDYWNGNRGGVERTIAHMLSGKSTGCGIAYVGQLCNDTLGYGLSGALSYNFDINNPGIGWDIMVVSHEIGHNFGSPHTHCYAGWGGNSQPVDKCYSGEGGCYSGVESLPCSGQSGCGTLMSYCHTYRGWYSDISLTFGAGHPHGDEPDRVPERMQAHVVSRANSYPGCLDPVIHGPELTITKEGNGTGTVTSEDGGIDCGSDCSETYELYTVVDLTATPGANSTFAGWSGDPDCSNNSVNMDEDKTCTATFTLVTRSLTVDKAGTGSGTVTSSPAGINCGGDCQESYTHGTPVQLTATPASGSVFSGWSGDADCSDGSVTMDEDLLCTATFTKRWTLIVTRSGPGAGTVTSSPAGISCGGDCQQTYNQGTVVSLTPTPTANSVFAGWSGDADCTDNTVSMSSDKTCNAIFNLAQRTLQVGKTGTGSGTITSNPAGIDCGSDCQQSYDHGTPVQLTPTPDAASVFTGWSGHADCADGNLTMDANKSCTADFQALYPLTVAVTGSGGGRVTSNPTGIDCGGDCGESYLHGTAVSLTATPDFGSESTGWGGDGDCGDGQLSMTGSRSCTVAFDPCSIESEEDFSGETVADTREYVACNLLTAGDFVVQAPGGDVTFRAGNSIVLRDGFVVELGASFRAVIGPPD